MLLKFVPKGPDNRHDDADAADDHYDNDNNDDNDDYYL